MLTQLYKIIHDEKALSEFIRWLPDLQNNEKYYCSMFARKKYSKQLIDSSDRTQLKRFTATKENLIFKVRQLEIPLGRYKLKDKEVPQESLVLYIHPNPRDMKKATKQLGKKCWDLLHNENYNIHAEALSCIQKSKSTKSPFVMFDIDSRDVDLSFLDTVLAPDSYYIIETKNGYHLLVESKKANTVVEISSRKGYSGDPDDIIVTGKLIGDKMWHKKIRDYYGEVIDNVGDFMTPIVGTIQGGHVPRFITT